MEVCVVGDLKVGTDVGKSVEGNVLQSLVVVDDEGTVNLGKVRGGEGFEAVALEDAEVSDVDLGQSGNVQGTNGTERDVVG